MIEEERSPALRGRSPSPRHILGNRDLAHIDAELEQFSMDARSAPERVSQAHLADQPTNFEGYSWPADSSTAQRRAAQGRAASRGSARAAPASGSNRQAEMQRAGRHRRELGHVSLPSQNGATVFTI